MVPPKQPPRLAGHGMQPSATHSLIDIHRDRLIVDGEDAGIVTDTAVDTLVMLQNMVSMSVAWL